MGAVRAVPWVVGLTGGIGAGKTVVAESFRKLGASIVDTDAIAHQLSVLGGAAIEPIREAFGDAVIGSDGALDRKAMRQRAFADPAARKRLEAILHPMIREHATRQLSEARAAPYAMLVVPLLFESMSYRDRVQRTLLIDCPVEMQIDRVGARAGIARQEAERIIEAQAPRAVRLQLADLVLVNGGAIGALDAHIVALHHEFVTAAAAHNRGLPDL
ncbi:MAG: dephospho-CoA kinase [Betaproteobacteria bacterium]|nr:dephospho-CoA kinase [Betaproteobacteria bacterium]